MSILDGYTVAQVPEARIGTAIQWSRLARIQAGPAGSAWTVENNALMRFDGTVWQTEALEEPGDRMIVAMPVGGGAVLVLFADRLALYRPDSHSWRVLKLSRELGSFSRMTGGFHDDFWITAQHGIAQLKLDTNLGISSWKQSDTASIGLVDIDEPSPSAAGEEVFFAARPKGSHSSRAVGRWFDVTRVHSRMETVRIAIPDNLRGWRGPDGELWTMEGASLRRFIGGKWIAVEKFGVLAGSLFEVATERDGGFWIGTSEGIAHYPPHVWTMSDLVRELDQPVTSIAEDALGRLWFASTDICSNWTGQLGVPGRGRKACGLKRRRATLSR